jgi:hypothetical protein
VSPSGSLAELDDPGAETGQEHNNAGGSGQDEARACVRADVGADDLFDDDVHMFIVLAPRFVSYWGCPGADPENPETVSGEIRAGKQLWWDGRSSDQVLSEELEDDLDPLFAVER